MAMSPDQRRAVLKAMMMRAADDSPGAKARRAGFQGWYDAKKRAGYAEDMPVTGAPKRRTMPRRPPPRPRRRYSLEDFNDRITRD